MKKLEQNPTEIAVNITQIPFIFENQSTSRSGRWVHRSHFCQLETQGYTFSSVKKISGSKKWKFRFLDCASFSKLRFWRVIVTRPHAKLRKFVPDGFQTFSIFFTLTIVWSNPVSQEIALNQCHRFSVQNWKSVWFGRWLPREFWRLCKLHQSLSKCF